MIEGSKAEEKSESSTTEWSEDYGVETGMCIPIQGINFTKKVLSVK